MAICQRTLFRAPIVQSNRSFKQFKQLVVLLWTVNTDVKTETFKFMSWKITFQPCRKLPTGFKFLLNWPMRLYFLFASHATFGAFSHCCMTDVTPTEAKHRKTRDICLFSSRTIDQLEVNTNRDSRTACVGTKELSFLTLSVWHS